MYAKVEQKESDANIRKKKHKHTKTVKTKQTEAIKQLEKLKFNKIKFEEKNRRSEVEKRVEGSGSKIKYNRRMKKE